MSKQKSVEFLLQLPFGRLKHILMNQEKKYYLVIE